MGASCVPYGGRVHPAACKSQLLERFVDILYQSDFVVDLPRITHLGVYDLPLVTMGVDSLRVA